MCLITSVDSWLLENYHKMLFLSRFTVNSAVPNMYKKGTRIFALQESGHFPLPHTVASDFLMMITWFNSLVVQTEATFVCVYLRSERYCWLLHAI